LCCPFDQAPGVTLVFFSIVPPDLIRRSSPYGFTFFVRFRPYYMSACFILPNHSFSLGNSTCYRLCLVLKYSSDCLIIPKWHFILSPLFFRSWDPNLLYSPPVPCLLLRSYLHYSKPFTYLPPPSLLALPFSSSQPKTLHRTSSLFD